jgi:hypothetical protein
MTIPKTAVILAHGAWLVPEHYKECLDLLEAKGHKIVAPLFPSSRGRPFPENPPEEDIALLREETIKLIDEGYNVLAMAHSAGGVTVCEAMYGLGIEERRKKGLQGGVCHLFFVAAFIPDEGHTIETDAPVDAIGVFRYVGDEKLTVPALDLDNVLMSDVADEELKKWSDLLVPCPKPLSFYTPKHFAYREIHNVFVF